MHVIARMKYCDGVKTLINAGISLNKKNKEGETPLHIAVKEHNNCLMIKLLLNAGAEINALNFKGETPAYIAASLKNILNLEILEKNGGDYGNKDKPDISFIAVRQCPDCANTYTEDFYPNHRCV